MQKMMLTILTPTYNRAHTLPRLYQSLLRQQGAPFEWLVVDDGSSDGTRQLVAGYIKEKKIDIGYCQRPNGGKHRALNFGVPKAKGSFIYILDSDDWLADNVVGSIIGRLAEVKDLEGCAGISGIRLNAEGRPMGSGLPWECREVDSVALRTKYRVTGEMAEIYKKRVLLQHPFPEYEGEIFLSECVVWNAIASRYKLRYYNVGFCHCCYRGDGLTRNLHVISLKNPLGAMLAHKSLIAHSPGLREKLVYAYRYWLYGRGYRGTLPREVKVAAPIRLLFPLFGLYKRAKSLVV